MKDKIVIEGSCEGEGAMRYGHTRYSFEMNKGAFVVLTGLRDIVCSNPLELHSVSTMLRSLLCRICADDSEDDLEPDCLELVVEKDLFFWRFWCGDDCCKTEETYFDDMERMWA